MTRVASRHFVLAAIVALCAWSLIGAPDGPEPADGRPVEWLIDIDEGLQVAQASGKDLLINFTGQGWCRYCTRLDESVFDHPEFSAAAEHFVLVELRSPTAPDAQMNASDSTGIRQAERFRRWQSQYLVRGFPTVVVADSRGRPIAYTNYEHGMSAASFLNKLGALQAARTARDQAFEQAERAIAGERARRLDASLECIVPYLGTLADRQGDPLLAWYGEIVAEICRLDARDTLGLRTKYERRRQHQEMFLQSEAVFTKLNGLKSSSEALNYIEQVLPSVTDSEMIWRLEFAKQVHLEWSGQFAAAVDNARRLLQTADLARDKRENLHERIAFNLKNLGRYAEAVSQLDELITANLDRPDRLLKYLESKAWYLENAASAGGDRQAALTAFEQWRSRCLPRSDDWETATWGLSRQLQQLKRHREALALRQEIVDARKSPAALLDLAETQLLLGAPSDALRSLNEAEQLLGAMRVARPAERAATKERLTARLRELREKAGQSHP